MANIGSKTLVFLFLVFFIPIFSLAQEKTEEQPINETIPKKNEKLEIKETKQPDVHQKMLEKLNISATEENESFLRRGEIVFFIAFGYTYLYQFMIYDQILPGTFRAGAQKGYLADRNLYFAFITSLFLALFVARNDIQKQNYLQTGNNYVYPGVDLKTPYNRESKSYNWYFNFFSWNF